METRSDIIKVFSFDKTIKVFDIRANDIKLSQIDYLLKTPINIMTSLNPDRYFLVF